MSSREEARRKFDKLKKDVDIQPKKFTYGNKTVVVMPSPVQKKDFTDYDYGKNIDEKVVKAALGMAERMAISLIREAIQLNTEGLVDKIAEQLTERIIEAMPEQKTVIQQVVSEHGASIKQDGMEFMFEGADIAIDRSKGLKLHGKVGETTESEESTDDALDMLDNLQL